MNKIKLFLIVACLILVFTTLLAKSHRFSSSGIYIVCGTSYRAIAANNNWLFTTIGSGMQASISDELGDLYPLYTEVSTGAYAPLYFQGCN